MEDISNNSQENFKPVLTSPFFEECIQANFSNLEYPKLLNVTKVAQWAKIWNKMHYFQPTVVSYLVF